MSKNLQLQIPVIEMVTQEEAHNALVREALRRKVPDVDGFLATHDVESRVAYRNIPGPGGTHVMMTSVVILSAKPKPPPPPTSTETPKPKE
jgi:hypothetical protein